MIRIPHHPSFDFVIAFVLLTSVFVPLVSSHSQLLAATYSHNPYGGADSCSFVNGQTVLYGWAYDPDTGSGPNPYVTLYAGSASAKVGSRITGYRDAAVNAYVQNHNPGAPATGGYGWKWAVSGLTQGYAYTVKGTVLNYGAGSRNASLIINTGRFSGMSSSQYPFTSAHTIPDVCLAPRPAATAPAAPAPTPAPTPTSSPSSASVSTKKTTTPKSSPAPPATPTAPAPSEINSAIGTTSATFSLPTSGASNITAQYGTNLQVLSQSATAPSVAGTTSVVVLKNLLPKTTYGYTLSRILNGQTATSPVATFTTKGYDLKFQFVDGNNKPVDGIHGTIDRTSATSDRNGTMSFSNMDGGEHALHFSYQGTHYTQTVSTFDATGGDGHAQIASKVINLSDIRVTAAVTPKSSSHTTPLIASVIGVLLGLGILVAWLFLRRGMTPAPKAASPFADPLVMHKLSSPKTPHEDLPANAGKSLATMVMEAMQQEQAAKQHSPTEAAPEESIENHDNLPPSVPPPMMPPRP